MKIARVCCAVVLGLGCLFLTAAGTCDMMGNGNPGDPGNPVDPVDPGSNTITLNLVKLNVQATTASGPTVGDGVLAFNANGNAILAWLNAGETLAKEVPAPAGMTHDSQGFSMQGKKLVVKDQNSGSIYVFDTVAEQVQAIGSASVNLGSSGKWNAHGHLVATINATVTTQDGPNLIVKVTDISNINAFATTPFNDPVNNPNAISVDSATGMIAVRGGDTFFIYDVNNPGAPVQTWTLSALQGGVGSTSPIKLRGNFIAFFDDNDDFSLLNIATGIRNQPARNPGRPARGLGLEGNVFAYFVTQTADDGSTIAVINRAIMGNTADTSAILDPAGAFVSGSDDTNGRIGFGASVGISPNGRFVFLAGASPVGVSLRDRLFMSTDGGNFMIVADPADPNNALRAAAVGVSNNLVAFLIPADLNAAISSNTIGYATLPPP